MKKYITFINESLRNNFKVGDRIIVDGYYDIKIDNQKGTIINKFGDDTISVEFDNGFNKRLHGRGGKTWSIPLYSKTITIRFDDNDYIDDITKIFLPPISQKLIIESKIVYVKYTDKVDIISYLNLNKSEKLKNAEYWTSKQRQEIKIGRFLKKIFPNKNQSSIEKMVNEYKSKYKIYFGIYDMELVDGEDIRKFYYKKNYDGSGGRLHSSCMRQKDDQYRFDIYVENPDVCKMLIMKSPNDDKKIIGRALVWKLKDGRTYMDRVYYANDDEFNVFLNYAKEKKWITYDSDGYNSKMIVKLTTDKTYGPCTKNPYMDTFSKYDENENELHTKKYKGGYDYEYDDY